MTDGVSAFGAEFSGGDGCGCAMRSVTADKLLALREALETTSANLARTRDDCSPDFRRGSCGKRAGSGHPGFAKAGTA